MSVSQEVNHGDICTGDGAAVVPYSAAIPLFNLVVLTAALVRSGHAGFRIPIRLRSLVWRPYTCACTLDFFVSWLAMDMSFQLILSSGLRA